MSDPFVRYTLLSIFGIPMILPTLLSDVCFIEADYRQADARYYMLAESISSIYRDTMIGIQGAKHNVTVESTCIRSRPRYNNSHAIRCSVHVDTKPQMELQSSNGFKSISETTSTRSCQ